MHEMKYVVVKSVEQGEQLFVFPMDIDHDRFAEVLSHIRVGGKSWARIFREPIAAGFTDGVYCYGRSETLNLDSRPKVDSALLEQGGQQ